MTTEVPTIITPAPPTDLWQWLEREPLGATFRIYRAQAIAATLRRAMCDESPILHGSDGHNMSVCVEMLYDELDTAIEWLEEHLGKIPVAAVA